MMPGTCGEHTPIMIGGTIGECMNPKGHSGDHGVIFRWPKKRVPSMASDDPLERLAARRKRDDTTKENTDG